MSRTLGLDFKVDYSVIAAGAMLDYAIGLFFYGFLFNKSFKMAMELDKGKTAQKPSRTFFLFNSGLDLALGFLKVFFLAVVLGFLYKHPSSYDGARGAVLVYVGFSLPSTLSARTWEARPPTLFVIETLKNFVSYTLLGILLTNPIFPSYSL